MICNACKSYPHDSQPKECQGGTWCDCHHRLPREMNKEEKSE